MNSATPLSCGATAGSCAGSAAIADLVGYGTAADFEGADAAPAPDATSAIARAAGGCTDTDSNTADFSTDRAPRPSTRPRRRAVLGRRRLVVDLRQRVGPPADPARDRDRARPADARLRRPRRRSNGAAGRARASRSRRTTRRATRSPHTAARSRRVTCRSDCLRQRLPAATLGAGISSTVLAALPIAPAADLTIGSTSAAAPASRRHLGDEDRLHGPLPSVPAGQYTATVTYTVIPR